MILHPTHACPDFLESFSDFVDGTLPPGHQAEIQAHLDCCEACLRHLAAYRRGLEILADMAGVELEPATFWATLQHRLWHEDLGAGAPRRRTWRAPSFAALATAAVAIAVVWSGMRVGEGLERVAGRAQAPGLVTAEPSTAATPAQAPAASGSQDAIASRAPAPPASHTVQLARANPRPASRTEPTFAEPALEREFQALRARIEAEAWFGPPEPIVSYASLEPAGLRSGPPGAVRIRMAEVRPSEPIPIVRSSLGRP